MAKKKVKENNEIATTQQMTQSGLLDVPRGMDLLDTTRLNFVGE